MEYAFRDLIGSCSGPADGLQAAKEGVVALRAALLGALMIIGLAGPVHADPSADTDTAFLASLHAAGITYNRVDQVIITAKLVCQFIAEGKPSPEVLEGLKERNPGLTTEHGTQFVGIAAQSYCPDQLVQKGAAAAP